MGNALSPGGPQGLGSDCLPGIKSWRWHLPATWLWVYAKVITWPNFSVPQFQHLYNGDSKCLYRRIVLRINTCEKILLLAATLYLIAFLLFAGFMLGWKWKYRTLEERGALLIQTLKGGGLGLRKEPALGGGQGVPLGKDREAEGLSWWPSPQAASSLFISVSGVLPEHVRGLVTI